MDDLHAQIARFAESAPSALTPSAAMSRVRQELDTLEQTVVEADGKASDCLIAKLAGKTPEDLPIESMIRDIKAAADRLSEACYVLDESTPIVAAADKLMEALYHVVEESRQLSRDERLRAVTMAVRPLVETLESRLRSMENRERKRQSDELERETAEALTGMSVRLQSLELERAQKAEERKATATLRGAYILYNAALDHLTDTVENPRPSVMEAYHFLKTALNSIIDREDLDVPPTYELPSSYGTFRKQLGRANKIDWDKISETGTD